MYILLEVNTRKILIHENTQAHVISHQTVVIIANLVSLENITIHS